MNSLSNSMGHAWKHFFSYDHYDEIPQWQRLLVTVLFAMGIAVIFTIVGFVLFAPGDGAWHSWQGWLRWYGRNLIVSLTVNLMIYAAFYLLYRFMGPQKLSAMPAKQQRWLYGLLPMTVVVVAWPLGVNLAGGNFMKMFGGMNDMNDVVRFILIFGLIGFLFNVVFSNKARALEAEKRETAARLQLLQAQIEPHFLFNTLANVQSLMDHDLPKAKQMLGSFTDYLRASLVSLRSEHSAVAHELDLAQNYLQLLQGRMEDRLRFSISADEAARQQPLPSLLLQPLVENAIVHGLEPSIEGGTVQVSARVDGQRLILEVQDDGAGPDVGTGAAARTGRRPGNGLALENIRQRLQARYGDNAALTVQATHPGTLARISVPLQSIQMSTPMSTALSKAPSPAP